MRIAILFLLCICLIPAQAIEANSCRNGLFPRHNGNIEFAEIVATEKEKINFRDDVEGCPGNASCIQKAYLVNGNKLLVSEKHKHWVCGWYFGKTREYVGWLPAKYIKALTPAKPPLLQEWIGVWKPIAGENKIQIRQTKTKDTLALVGEATWIGGKTQSGEHVVHVGEFEGNASPAGARITIGNTAEEYGCVVKMQLVSGNLVVNDNNNCGGMNVSFSDVYRKQ